MKNKLDVSIVLCGTRIQDLKEADVLVKSIRKLYSDSIEILLFTSIREYKNESIDEILIIEKPYYGFADKVYTIVNTPREKFIYIDADTYMLDRIDEVFALIEKFDIAVAHAPNRWTVHLPNVPDSYPEYNTGVVLFKRSEKVNRFLEDWFKKFLEQVSSGIKMPSGDQVSFRELLYFSDLKCATLTPEYNCRFNIGSLVSHKVKILHGRIPDFASIENEINTGPTFLHNNQLKMRYLMFPEDYPYNKKNLGNLVIKLKSKVKSLLGKK